MGAAEISISPHLYNYDACFDGLGWLVAISYRSHPTCLAREAEENGAGTLNITSEGDRRVWAAGWPEGTMGWW